MPSIIDLEKETDRGRYRLMRIKYLDVLKAVAIIAVVLYHADILGYGYLGVDVFLVLSGFFVARSLEGKKYFSFVVSRILRLLPVLLVAGLVAMAAGWFTMLPDDYENLGESVVATNLFANNILSAITTGDYWNIGNKYKPLMHTWYVGLLMQFAPESKPSPMHGVRKAVEELVTRVG